MPETKKSLVLREFLSIELPLWQRFANTFHYPIKLSDIEFAQLARLTHQKLGMSQEDLAHAIHIRFATSSDGENGKTRLNQLNETIFFDKYGIKLEILSDTEE